MLLHAYLSLPCDGCDTSCQRGPPVHLKAVKQVEKHDAITPQQFAKDEGYTVLAIPDWL